MIFLAFAIVSFLALFLFGLSTLLATQSDLYASMRWPLFLITTTIYLFNVVKRLGRQT